MKKPTFASITRKPCKCKYLQQQADEPGVPIVFDKGVNEYHITHPGGGYSVIYHCPFCGGVAPESRRASLFAVLTCTETSRLARLTTGIASVEEAVKRFGPPQEDHPHGTMVMKPAKGRQPPMGASYRMVKFTQLSESADVVLIDQGTAGVRITFHGKYLGGSGARSNKRMQLTRSAKARQRGPRS